MTNTKTNFKTASEAFDYFYIKIKNKGVEFDNTKALFNIGFYIHNPSDKQINTKPTLLQHISGSTFYILLLSVCQKGCGYKTQY